MSDLLKRLAKKYAPPGYVTLFEVRNAAGFRANRSADAIVMSIWPSRGLTITGVEMKVSRGDWLRELKKPEKAESIAAYCDHWVVLADTNVVKVDEVPPAWGLLVPSGNGLKWEKPSEKTEAKPLTRDFLACLLRRATEGVVHVAEIQDRLNEKYKEGIEQADKNRGFETRRIKSELEVTKRHLDIILRSCGSQHIWHDSEAERIGERIKAALAYEHKPKEEHLEMIRHRVADMRATADRLEAAMNGVTNETNMG